MVDFFAKGLHSDVAGMRILSFEALNTIMWTVNRNRPAAAAAAAAGEITGSGDGTP